MIRQRKALKEMGNSLPASARKSSFHKLFGFYSFTLVHVGARESAALGCRTLVCVEALLDLQPSWPLKLLLACSVLLINTSSCWGADTCSDYWNTNTNHIHAVTISSINHLINEFTVQLRTCAHAWIRGCVCYLPLCPSCMVGGCRLWNPQGSYPDWIRLCYPLITSGLLFSASEQQKWLNLHPIPPCFC